MPAQYKRVLLKLSGEALKGDDTGIDPETTAHIAERIKEVHETGVQVAVVVGGGNLFRGRALQAAGLDRVAGDHMGMLATVMNGLAMRDALERSNIATQVMSAIPMSGVVDHYDRRKAIRALSNGDVVIFTAGTGNPFFTTDTAASLRAIEIGADILLKATKVDGVYDSDPVKNADARRYETVSFDQLLADKLLVMDATAVVMCRDNDLPLRVFDLTRANALVQAMTGDNVGTLVTT